MLTSLAGQFFNGDYFNFFGFMDGVYDSTQQTLQTNQRGGPGFDIGGGVTGSKTFSTSVLSLSYRGEFRDYSSGFGGNGTNQYLSVLYTKRLSARWTLSFNESAGILFYSNAYFGTLGSNGGAVETNPFSSTSRFLSSGVNASYRQSQRLTYTVSGNFFLNRYNYGGAIGSTGGVESVSATYALTARTSFGGTYSHDNFYYQHAAGNSQIDGVFGTVAHTFGKNWVAHVSAGYTRVHSAGIIDIPVSVILGGQNVIGYEVGAYNTITHVPTIVGNLSHSFGRFTLGASGGHSVNPGNGTYLTSSNTFFGGVISRSFRKSSLNATFNYSDLTSISNTIAQGYKGTFITTTYSRILIPHMSGYVGYQYQRYGALLAYGSSSLNRIIAGINFSSKNIPMTQF